MYNMWQISKEAYIKCENKIIEDGRYFLINRRDLETESDSGNQVQIFDKCYPKKQRYRQELILSAKFL